MTTRRAGASECDVQGDRQAAVDSLAREQGRRRSSFARVPVLKGGTQDGGDQHYRAGTDPTTPGPVAKRRPREGSQKPLAATRAA